MVSVDARDLGERLADSPLLAGLDAQQREAFMALAIAQPIDEPGLTFVHEGRPAEDFYIILEGRAEVYRSDEGGEYVLAELGPGDHFGETALVREVKRTASVRTQTPLRLAVVKARPVRDDPARHDWLAPFLLELVRHDASRVDRLTTRTVDGLRGEAERGQRAALLGQLMAVVLLGLAIYVIGAGFIVAMVGKSLLGRALVVVLQLGIGAALIALMVRSGRPRGEFGLRRADSIGRELGESLVVTSVVILGLTGFKYGLMQAVPERGLSLFAGEPVAIVELVALIAFAACIPVQELCVRGILQGSLEQIFRASERGAALAIVLSSALLAVTYTHLSPLMAILVFAPSLVWGWLYLRHRSLLGVSLSHLIAALWAMRVLGLGEILSSS